MFFLNTLYNLLEKITEYALEELYDEAAIKRKLMDLAIQYELHEINEQEYDLYEKKLLAQLREARRYNKEKSEMEEEEGEELGAEGTEDEEAGIEEQESNEKDMEVNENE